ncbi:MAG TPA: hypothetical protein VF260_02570 [Bacilli bacterium]
MVRTAASAVLGFLLIIVQSIIVMKMDHYTSIQFTSPQHMLTIWIINFFLAYSVLTQITIWMANRGAFDSETTEK